MSIILFMRTNWDEKSPYFAQICYEVKDLNYLIQEISLDFNEYKNQNISSQIKEVNSQIIGYIDQMSKLAKFIQKKLFFYGFEEQSKKKQFRSFQQILFLPIAYARNQVTQIKKRKSSYIPRQKNRGPYRSYTIQEKNHVVYLHEIGLKFATISKRLGIPQKNVVRWCKQGFLGKSSTSRIADIKMQEKLGEWLSKFKNFNDVKQNEIQQKALKMTSNKHFKASRGWLKNFLKRYFKKEETEIKIQQK